jgi:N-acetylneuraminic acid mutarotase
MKKQINPTIKAHLIRSACYVLLLVAVCVIPFALAQRNTPKANQTSAAKQPTAVKQPGTAHKARLAAVAAANARAKSFPSSVVGAMQRNRAPSLPRTSQVPLKTSGLLPGRARLAPSLPKGVLVTLYDQYDNAGLASTGSQNFEPDFDAFDDFTADDFAVPGGETWNILEVDVLGTYFNGFGPANSFNVFIYQDDGTFPGTLVYSATDLAFTTADNLNFVIPLTAAATLNAGTYWVSVQANEDFGVGGQWGWTDRTVQAFSGAAFMNPGGGFACPGGNGWVRKPDCVATADPDQVYRLLGTTGGGVTPTPTPPPTCIVVNGDFETGDLTGWTNTGDTSATGVDGNPHSGSFALFAGPVDSDGFLDQVLPTVDGQAYDVTFWLENDDASGDNRFGASLGGVVLVPEGSQAPFGYTEYTFNGVVPGANADLQFIFYNPPSFFYLDDVCVTPSGGGGTPTPTPSCSPGPWQEVAPMTTDLYGAAGASDGTNFYAAGGYSFSQGATLNILQKYDGSSWTTLSPMPQSAALGCGVYDPTNNKFYVFGGEDAATGQNYNLTQIYDIASDTWSNGANMPDVHSFEACGYNPGDGMIYVLSGYNTGTVDSAQPNTWQYDPVLDTWTDLTGTDPYPHPAGGFGFGVINNKLYTAGGRDAANAVINDTWEFDPAAPAGSRYTQKTDEPGTFQNNVPGSAAAQGVLWVYGGGNPFVADGRESKAGITAPTSARVAQTKRSFPIEFIKRLFGHKPNAPDTDSSGRFYDPISDSWSNSPNMNEARSFTSGAAIGNNLIIAAGGFNGAGTVSSAETENVCAGGGVTPTPTPSASPTCPPGSPNGVAGTWTAGNPYPTTITRYAFAQTATHFYVFGGVDNGFITNAVNRMDLATGNWEPRAAMPTIGGEAPTCALDASSGIVYCTDGTDGPGFFAYDIAADSWTTLASIPDGLDTYGSASGAFNGNVFVCGGFSHGSTVWVYNIAGSSWSPGTAAPTDFSHAGYQQVGQFLYVIGGWDVNSPTTNKTTSYRLDMSSAPGTWDTGPTFTQQRADFGLAYDAGTNKLYAMAGDASGGAFFDSTNLVDELDLSAWPGGTWNPSPPDLPLPIRQGNEAGVYGNGDIWSVGGIDGFTFQFFNEVWHRNNGGVVCPSPTPTPSITPPISPTPTVTPTPTITPPVSPTPTITPPPLTPTPTPTETPRETPTPRPRPTPHPRPPH